MLDPTTLSTLHRLPLPQAKTTAAQLIAASKTAPNKKAYLLNQINAVPTVNKLVSLMYNTFLAGENLSVVGSKYQARFA